MRQFMKLVTTGIFAGIILALFLKWVQAGTGNQAYTLLFNMDYIPILKQWNHVDGMGMVFHFTTCITSVVVLYYLLKRIGHHRSFLPYVLTYTIGGGVLYSLSALTNTPPAFNDFAAWAYWTLGHAIYGVVVGVMVKKDGCQVPKQF